MTGSVAYDPQMSADGRFVLFDSTAQGITADSPEDRPCQSWYVRDRATRTTKLVSTRSDGTPLTGCMSYAELSGDGRSLAFYSTSPDLVPAGHRANQRLLIKDLRTGEVLVRTRPVPEAEAARYGVPDIGPQVMSRDGRFIAVRTSYQDYYRGGSPALLYDRRTNQWQRICPIGAICNPLSMSYDGRFTTYTYQQQATAAPPSQIRIFDRLTGTSRVVPTPHPGDDIDPETVFSGDGQLLFALRKRSSTGTDRTQVFRVSDLKLLQVMHDEFVTGADETGRYVVTSDVSHDPRRRLAAYRLDRATGARLPLDKGYDGKYAFTSVVPLALSRDGQKALLFSPAHNLIRGDLFYNPDVYQELYPDAFVAVVNHERGR